MDYIWYLVLGGVAGWLAGKVFKGNGYGVIVDVILGLVGGLVGGWLCSVLNINLGGKVGFFITAFVGAVILVWLSRLIKGKA